jgi:hypothetical protein
MTVVVAIAVQLMEEGRKKEEGRLLKEELLTETFKQHSLFIRYIYGSG